MMQRFPMGEVDAQRQATGESYLEFLRERSMSMGLYVLRVGEEDKQQPHGEDEVYFVIRGKGRFRAGDEDCAVGSGDVLYVGKGVEHRFHAITEALELLVFFAPAEGTGRAQG
jgi:mannose-6-phosphate isomerase-like protein (cupin superfamily)